MDNTGKCTICGGLFTMDVVVDFGADTTFRGSRNDSVICEECNKLSHYEQRKLYLLNCLVEKKPHGYWKEVAAIQKALEYIAEQSLRNTENKIYLDGKDISDKILENNSE